MRQEIFARIAAAIGEKVPEIQHIDLWNQNVSFIDQEEAWPRPAAFIEFLPIGWEPVTGRPAYKGKGRVQIHVVTDWVDKDSASEAFRLSDKVAKSLAGLKGDYFSGFEMLTTYTNHNHEDLVENIEEFSYRCQRSMD